MLTLHDHLNPNQEVPVEASAILAATPFGSGSALSLSSGATIAVHETPSQVMQLIKENQ